MKPASIEGPGLTRSPVSSPYSSSLQSWFRSTSASSFSFEPRVRRPASSLC
ncbi:hypothetical protein ACFFX0_17120 [Citricoccus parietis]|uniref:Uncharacterized protein n=1 Tax=Citricoccus parietis TaxID=592307 RepID=A0ABV5G1L5_9MICC